MEPLHGEIHGSIIRLSENPGLPEGQAVEVSVKVVAQPASDEQPCGEQPGAGLKRAFGGLTDWSEEDDRILAELAEERKRPSRRFDSENDPFA